MDVAERSILKKWQNLFDENAQHLTEQDAFLLYKASHRILSLLLQAEQPFNPTRVYHDQANTIIQHMNAFIAYRENENWSKSSTFLYESLNAILTKKPIV